jgi:SsrA-binding protein
MMAGRMAERDADRKVVATNRRARYEYEILDTVEAGLVLLGPEVKSLRAGKANLSDAYATIRHGEAWLHHVHISPYEQAGRDNPDPRRPRKLLLHRAEISRLQGKVAERGLTLVPLELYFKDGRAKVRLGLARGKRRHDKRESIRRREEERDMQRVTRRGRRGS